MTVTWVIRFNLFLVLFIFPHFLAGQNLQYFKVLDQDERISGTFGEIRANHFHSGVDYKTGEKEGLPIYAAADGYISRVKVSSVGYGKVLYINHADGNTTVYAHLREFYPAVADSVIKLQQQKQAFEVEFFPKMNEFPVTGGQLIGFSGNSGGSEGPHLHFEIRNTLSEKPYKPDKLGYLIKDSIPPLISSLVIYQPGPFKGLYGSTKNIYPIGDPISPTILDTLKVDNEFFIGFEAYDLAGLEPNKLGISSFNLFRNNDTIYSYTINEFSFDETRMVNSCIDYSFKQDSGRTVLVGLRLPGNELEFCGTRLGLINLTEDHVSEFRLELTDYAGNIQKLEFKVRNSDKSSSGNFAKEGFKYKYGESAEINEALYQIKIHEKSFYENLILNHTVKQNNDTQSLSALVSIEPINQAVNKPISLTLNTFNVPEQLQSKVLLARVDSLGKMRSMGGKFADGKVTTSVRTLGNFMVVADTTPPIAELPVWRIDDLYNNEQLIISVKDDLSGIIRYACYLDENWVCGEFNAYRGEIAIPFNNFDPLKQSQMLKILLTDQKSNSAEFLFEIQKTNQPKTPELK